MTSTNASTMDAQAILSTIAETAVVMVPAIFLADLMAKVNSLTAKVDQLLDAGTPEPCDPWLEAPVQEPEVGNSETYQVDLPGIGRPGTGAVIEEPVADAVSTPEEPTPVAPKRRGRPAKAKDPDAVTKVKEPKEPKAKKEPKAPKAPKKTTTKAQAIASPDSVTTVPVPVPAAPVPVAPVPVAPITHKDARALLKAGAELWATMSGGIRVLVTGIGMRYLSAPGNNFLPLGQVTGYSVAGA